MKGLEMLLVLKHGSPTATTATTLSIAAAAAAAATAAATASPAIISCSFKWRTPSARCCWVSTLPTFPWPSLGSGEWVVIVVVDGQHNLVCLYINIYIYYIDDYGRKGEDVIMCLYMSFFRVVVVVELYIRKRNTKSLLTRPRSSFKERDGVW